MGTKPASIAERHAAIERLREFLRLNYMTGAQAAQRIGVRAETLYSWLAGESKPASPERIEAFLESMPAERSGITPTGYEYREYKNWRGIPKPRRCPFCKKAKGEIRKARGGFLGVCPNCGPPGPQRRNETRLLRKTKMPIGTQQAQGMAPTLYPSQVAAAYKSGQDLNGAILSNPLGNLYVYPNSPKLVPKMTGETIYQLSIADLPDYTRLALATVAACRGITDLRLATDLIARYENDPDCKRRIDCVTTKILEAVIKKEKYTHLVPRDVEDALLIQLVMEVEKKRLWPGVGKVVMKSIDDAGGVTTVVRS